jgi:drug/metabolite transporter (DMT)-like permease
LTPPVVGVVVLAGLLHAGWNAIAHYIPDRRAGLALLAIAYTVVTGPLAIFGPVPPAQAWPWIVASAVVHVGYGFCLLASYRLGDFGHTYPLARAVAPLLVVAVGVGVLGQHLRLQAWVGLGLLCGGIVLVVAGAGCAGGGGGGGRPRAATLAAVATGVFIATYTLIDGAGVQHVETATTYVVWMFALQGPLTLVALGVGHGPADLLRTCRPYLGIGLVSGVVSLVAYGAVIWAQGRAPGNIGTIAATREIGIVFAALIGRLAFGERLGVARTCGAVIAFAGIAVLNV